MNSFLNILAFFALLNITFTYIQTSPIPNEDDQQKFPQENAIEGKPKILQAVLPGGFGGGGFIPHYNPISQMYPNQGMMPYPAAGQYPGMGYPGPYPGMGMGYPGQYPGMGYPGQYPGMGYPGQYPVMGYPGQYSGMSNPYLPYQQGHFGSPYNPYGGVGGFPAGGGIQNFNPLAPNPFTPMKQKN